MPRKKTAVATVPEGSALLSERERAEIAARAEVRREKYQEQAREQIEATKIVKLLQDHVLGKGRAKMTPAKLKAAEMLLERSLPTLSAVKHEVEAKHAVFNMTNVFQAPPKPSEK